MSFLTNLYQKVLISINIDAHTCKILTTYINKSNSEEKTFEAVNGSLSNKAVRYIKNIKARFPFSYVSTISKSKTQGLINGNNLIVFERFNLSPNSLNIMLINKQWFVYIAKTDMIKHKESFVNIGGSDFLFSSFCLLYENIKSNLHSSKKLYVLQERSSSVLMIADSSDVYFGNYVCFDDIMGGFEDSLESSDLKSVNTIINTIRETLINFYKDDRYASDFIEEILVFDTYGISDNAMAHIANNMMLDVEFISINICLEIEKLAKMELNL